MKKYVIALDEGTTSARSIIFDKQLNAVSVFAGGAVIQWLRDELRFISDASDSEYFAKKLKNNGGASANNFLMQFQADISNIEVVRPAQREATAEGAAMLAGKAVSFFESSGFGGQMKHTVFKPLMTYGERSKYINGWHKAVNSCLTKTEE